MDTSSLIGALIALGSLNRRVNANALASLVATVYNIVIHMDQEIELIWKAKWTFPKVLYVLLRYFTPLWLLYQCIIHLTPGNQLSKLSCTSFPPLQGVGVLVDWILIDCIMLVRLWALYRNNKAVLYLLGTSWLASAGVIIPITIYAFRLSHPIPAPPPFSSVAGCLVPSVDWDKMQNAKAASIAFIIQNSLFLALTVYKFLESARELKAVQFESLLSVFVGEGAAYFALIVCASSMDIVFSSGSPQLFTFSDVAQFWMLFAYSYGGCHLILHLRSIHSGTPVHATGFTDCGDLGMRFAPRLDTLALDPVESDRG